MAEQKKAQAAKPPPRKTRMLPVFLGLIFIAAGGYVVYYMYVRNVDLTTDKGRRELADAAKKDLNEVTVGAKDAADYASEKLIDAKAWLNRSLEDIEKRIKGKPPQSKDEQAALVQSTQKSAAGKALDREEEARIEAERQRQAAARAEQEKKDAQTASARKEQAQKDAVKRAEEAKKWAEQLRAESQRAQKEFEAKAAAQKEEEKAEARRRAESKAEAARKALEEQIAAERAAAQCAAEYEAAQRAAKEKSDAETAAAKQRADAEAAARKAEQERQVAEKTRDEGLAKSAPRGKLGQAQSEFQKGCDLYAQTDPARPYDIQQRYLRLAAPHFDRCLTLSDEARKEGAKESEVASLEENAARRLYDCRKRMAVR